MPALLERDIRRARGRGRRAPGARRAAPSDRPPRSASWPALRPRPSRACQVDTGVGPSPAAPRVAGLGELEASATRSPSASARPARRSPSAPRSRPATASCSSEMLAAPGRLQVGAGLPRRRRRARLRRTGIPAPPRPARDADGLVAGQGLLRMPVTGRLAAVEREAKPAKRTRRADERPPAPWGSFPLAELTVLAGIVAARRSASIGGNPTAIGVGVVLAGLGGLEVAVREHFAGYRSHTTLLAGAVFVLVVGAPLLPRRADPGGLPGGRRGRLRVAFFLAAPRLPARLRRPSFRVGGLGG